MPTLSLQPSLLSGNFEIIDLGTGTVGSGETVYRRLQSQLVLTGLSGTTATNFAKQSMIELGIDPASFLPAVLAYSIRPDNGTQAPIAIEIHYSDYRVIDGVQVPFLLQRYVNGSLQLTIAVSSAQIA